MTEESETAYHFRAQNLREQATEHPQIADDVDSDDYPEEAQSFHGDFGNSDAIATMVRSVSSSILNDANDNVLTRLSTVSKRLSSMNATQANEFLVNEDNFDLRSVLNYLNDGFEEKGLVTKYSGVELADVTVFGVDDSTSILPTVSDVLFAPVTVPKRLIFGDKSNVLTKTGDDRYRKILKNINLDVKPGEMCLVLGRPGAGCSSLLKTIVGETDQFVKVAGDITYNNIPLTRMLKLFRKELIYNPELDVHFPHLTVDQTLKFAIACRTPALRLHDFSRLKYIEVIRDLWATVFGLNHTLHTKVGNDFIRGVSGGERKRVSIAELMVTRGSVYCWDNATRGLDASTALEYAEAIRISTNLMRTSSFVAIYQAGENIFEKFDKVTVLYQGRQVYFGPAKKAKQYFIDMGFECPPRQSTAEFLTLVTDSLGRKARPGWELKVPRTAAEFEDYWINSPEFRELQVSLAKVKEDVSAEQTAELLHQNKLQEKMRLESKGSRYTINFLEQLKLCTVRGFQIVIGDKAYAITSIASSVIQGLIMGSLYYKVPKTTDGAFSRGGVVFFTLLYFSLMALAEVASTFEARPILYKQKGYSFFRPSAEVLASTLTQLPVKIISIILFAIITYFLTQLKQDAGSFFVFVFFTIIGSGVISSMFRMFASIMPTLSAANALLGVFMLACVLYSSYMIQRPSMVPWFKWFSYMNPLLYAFESMLTTEFHGRKMGCTTLVPSGKGYETVSPDNQVCGFTVTNGQRYVQGDFYVETAFSYYFSHVWRNFGILMLFWFGFLALNCLGAETMRGAKAGGDHLIYVRGAKIPDSIIGPDNSSSSSDLNSDDPEKGPVEKVAVEEEVDNNREVAGFNRMGATLGSEEIFMWKNVDYTIPHDGGHRQLLKDIQGFVKPGTLTALMGESGAGKTTLLNTLSQRIDMGVVTGDMLVNGKPITSSFKRRTGYVQQQDVHIEELTVRDSLQFAARLRRPASVPEEEKLLYVETIISILHMEDYADAVAGEAGFGLNVEQRKKLSIATELVAKPNLLLFLDEPTSGLDSQSAWAIVQLLRDLANSGQLILCTIHQPSATLFEEFDRLLLLKKGGQTVYFGDIGENSKTIVSYFERNGARKCDAHENPAEYILELIGAGATASVTEDWFTKWVESDEYRSVTRETEELILNTKGLAVVDDSEEANFTYAMPYWYQFKLVLSRTTTQFNRDLNYVMLKFMLMLLGGLLIGFSFFNVKHTVIGMQNTMFAVFISVILSLPLSNQIQVRAISSRELYEVRESKSNTFHWSTLLLSQFISEIPYSVAFSTVYFLIWYFAVQLDNEASRMGVYWLTYCIFFQLFYVSLALWVVYFSPDLPSANVIFAFLFNFILSFAGVVAPAKLLHFWTWMWKVSPVTYIIQNLLALPLHGREVHCSDMELSYLTPPLGQTCGSYLEEFLGSHTGYVDNPNSTTRCGYCQYSVADEYLDTLSISYSSIWRNVGFFCVYIGFNVLAMLAFYYLFRVNKRDFLAPLKKLISKRTNKP